MNAQISHERLQAIFQLVNSGEISKDAALLIAEELFKRQQEKEQLQELIDTFRKTSNNHTKEIKNLKAKIEDLQLNLSIETTYKNKYQSEYIKLTSENQELKNEVYKLMKYCEKV